MDADSSGRSSERDETAAERGDRNWDELLQELRVTQTGVQILAGFLLTLPFQQRFSTLPTHFRVVFLVAVGLATVTIALIVAPFSAHRMFFRRHEKVLLVTYADRLAKAGLTTLAATIATVTLLVFGVVAGLGVGIAAGSVALAFFLAQWVVVPAVLLRRHRSSANGDDTGQP